MSHQKNDILEKGLEVIVRSGGYPSREIVLQEAFALFLKEHPTQRLTVAIELYHDQVVSLAQAADLANLNIADFQAILQARATKKDTVDLTAEESSPVQSPAQNLLKYAGTWAGDDLEERLREVYTTRQEAEF